MPSLPPCRYECDEPLARLGESALTCISIDVGVKNLALARLEVSATAFRVRALQLEDVAAAAKETRNLNDVPIEALVVMFVAHAAPVLAAHLAADAVSIAFIEAQPLGPHACNVKTKVLSHVLQAQLLQAGVRVVFVGSSKKLRGQEGASGYAANKKFAVSRAAALLGEAQNETPSAAAWFAAVKGKRDDLADALLQGVYAARDELVRLARAAPRRRAAPPRGPKVKCAGRKRARKNAEEAAAEL